MMIKNLSIKTQLIAVDYTLLGSVAVFGWMTFNQNERLENTEQKPGNNFARMNGYDAFKAIRNDRHLEHVPVIAPTASAFVSFRKIIPARGFDAYLPKPIANKVSFDTLETTLYGN